MTNAVATEVRKYRQLIAGEWVDAEGGRTYDHLNPYHGSVYAKARAAVSRPLCVSTFRPPRRSPGPGVETLGPLGQWPANFNYLVAQQYPRD